jgi:hypothetical protein
MNWKINDLKKDVEFTESSLLDFPELHFGKVPDGTVVFDATEYCETENLDFMYETFLKLNKVYITRLLEKEVINPGNIWFMTPSRHLLINQYLAFIFLQFANPDAFYHFMQILSDAMTDGVAYSDYHVMSLAMGRIPTETLKEMISKRDE